MLRIFVLPCSLLLSTVTALGATITGVVTDRTTGKPSAGDTIAVINTAQSMDEIAKATSDAQGRFSVNAPDGGQILLHITHSGAEYFKSVQPGAGSADIDVYDSAKKIDGISGEALVLRAETDATGKTLNVAENFFVQNASAPPRTQYGGNTFDFYLPKGAETVQTLASSPGGLPTNSKVVTIDAASGHYAFTFPVRPGETRFQVAYSLPYTGKQPFSLKLSVPTGDVAVMLPKSMQFQGSARVPAAERSQRRQLPELRRASATLCPAGRVHSGGHRPVAGVPGHGAGRVTGWGRPVRQRRPGGPDSGQRTAPRRRPRRTGRPQCRQ
jgi:5-hydroxyisourate hydrolase-like protein (transthyretin family)